MPGMHKITEYDSFYNCRQVAELLAKNYPELYALDRYYYFGWNGKLCFDERKKAAHDLYKELLKIYTMHITAYEGEPYFRIISHSHGGNVVLNLAKIIPADSQIFIDECIILACPVQEKTKKYVRSPRFKKIYAFYSGNDMFQVLDPQRWYKKGKSKKLFSARTFDQCDNLRQARLRLNGSHPMHVDFFMPKIMAHLPLLCNAIDEAYAAKPYTWASYNHELNITYKEQQPVRIIKQCAY